MARQHGAADSGVTLLELLVAIIIITVGAGVLFSYLASVTRSPEPVLRARLVALGTALMEEIVAKRWDERARIGGEALCTDEGNPACPGKTASSSLGTDGGESLSNRGSLDDVDDYDGFSESGTFEDQEGRTVTIPGASRSVSVCYVSSSLSSVSDSPSQCVASGTTNTKRIVVTVTSPAGETFTLVTLRCNY